MTRIFHNFRFDVSPGLRTFSPHFPGKESSIHRGLRARKAYERSPSDFKEVVDGFVSLYEKNEKPDYEFRGKVIDFLASREKHGDLSKAMFFIRNLAELKKIKYEDGTKIKGVERLFENAEVADHFGDNPSGFYFEAIAGLSLIQNKFKIREFSMREISGEELVSSDGIDREVDIFAELDLDSEIVPVFIDAKSCFSAIGASQNKNHQLDALIEISENYNAVPVVVLRTKDPVLTPDGKLMDYESLSFSSHTYNGLIGYLAEKKMLMWDECGKELVPEKAVIQYRRNH